jgi:RNA polymerase sigma-70 factor, ECF subfamily
MIGDAGALDATSALSSRSASDFDAVWRHGAAQWPELDLGRPVFLAYLRRLGSAVDVGDAVGHASDLFLACACLERVPGALGAFESTYLARVPQFVARIGHDHDFVQEVAQTLRERLLVAHPPDPPRLASYSGRASLTSWVAVCAQRVALDHRRQRDAHTVVSESHAGAASAPDLETAYVKRRYSRVFEAAISTALSRMPPRERVLLRLWLYEQLSMERIGAMYGVNVSTVSRWLTKARQSLGIDIEALVREKLGVTDLEFASLSRLIHSQIDETVLRDLERSR